MERVQIGVFIITLILWLKMELAIKHLFKYFVCMCMMAKLLRLYKNTKKKYNSLYDERD